MEILKKIIIILLSTAYLISCGFTPIYSKKNLINFQINTVEFEGDREIKAVLLSNLNIYKNNEKSMYDYDLQILAKKNVEIVSKNTKGKATAYKLDINSTVKIFLNNELFLTKNYSNSSTYSSEKKVIKLKEVEHRNLLDLSSKLVDEIILTLSLANTN